MNMGSGDNEIFKSDFLFSTPGFLQGMGTVLNVGGNYFSFNYSQSPSLADAKALGNDWRMVGQDIRLAMHQIQNQLRIK